jgi:VWFA-related protein
MRVNTRLVLVDVVVTDKKGNPVNGLKPEDFTLEEKGKAQKIAVFAPPQEAQNQPEPPQLGPGIYTNKLEYRSPGGPVTAIVLDAANAPFKDQAYARLQMLKYVREQLKPGQRLGVFTLTNSLRVVQDFTGDPQLLITALDKYKPQEQNLSLPAPISTSATSVDGLSSAVQFFTTSQVSYVMDRRVEATLQAMRSLSRILGGMKGRKEIIWLTAAFPFDLIPENRDISEAELLNDLPNINVREKLVNTRAAGAYAATERGLYTQEIRDVAAQLASAQVAIYPVDVRGLVSGMEFQREDAAGQQASSVAGRAVVRMDDVTASQQTMRAIAQETGGKAYVNQNEIKEGVALALADNSASYTLGYYPTEKKWDGNYRSIKVKVAREGTEVRHRRGYFAIDRTQQKIKNPEQQVAEALLDGAPDTQVTFSAQVKPGDKGKVNVTFLVDPNTITAEEASGGSRKINFVLYAAVYSPEGKMLENRSTKVDQTFDGATFQKILQQGILVPMELDAQPGGKALRLAVQDTRTGLLGTLNAAMP